MVCEWRVEDKQTLAAQNVLNSNRFIDGCNSYKTAKTGKWGCSGIMGKSRDTKNTRSERTKGVD